MRRSFTRRVAIASGLSMAACTSTGALSAAAGDACFTSIEQTLDGGRLGVAALNTANGAWLRHRDSERFAMCSTFKWILAADILAQAQRGALRIDAPIHYTEADLLGYGPVTRANVGRGWMTIEELCVAAVELSDNTAANLLLSQIGGPAGLTNFIRAHGDSVTRLDRNEPMLNMVAPGDVRDTSTPSAMASTMRRVLLTDSALTEASLAKLIGWLVQSQTGANLLRAGMPAGWRIGDKTGNSGSGVVNDLAIVWPPSRAPILIACFIDAPAVSDEVRNAAHVAVARLVAETWS